MGIASHLDERPHRVVERPGVQEIAAQAGISLKTLYTAFDGKEFQVYETNFYGFPDPGDYLLMELLIHCSAPGTFTVVSLNNIGGAAGVTDVNFVDYPAADLNYAGAIVVIEQIPEPASLALLALGGLALIRRR